jgi:hypothetical protein
MVPFWVFWLVKESSLSAMARPITSIGFIAFMPVPEILDHF